MSKTGKLITFFAFLIVTGAIYIQFYRPEALRPAAANGVIREINMRVQKGNWNFCIVETEGGPCEVKPLEVDLGDTVRITMFNEDGFDHGWALEALGLNRRLFPNRDTLIEFVAAKAGTFQFFCSVPCGDGHYSQTGTLIVREAKAAEQPVE